MAVLSPRVFRSGLRFGGFVFQPTWIPTIATALMATLLFNLGLWQLNRAHYKETVLERMEQRADSKPFELTELLRMDADINDFPVQLRGRFLNDFNFLLDNRPHQQIPGYEVLTPMLVDNHIVLINRGWIAQGADRSKPPLVPALEGEIDVTGRSHVPNPDFFVLKEDEYTQVSWPFLIQKIDLEKSAPLFDYPMAPFILRLDPDPASGFVREWHSHFMGPEKHYGYAVQWFGLFAALLVIYVVVNTRRIDR